MTFHEENEETQPNSRIPGTLPQIPEWTPPHQTGPRFSKVRDHAGTAVLVVVILGVLTGIVLSSLFVPAVRNGVGKVLGHRETVKSPSLRESSAAPGNFSVPRGTVASITPRASRPVRHTVSPSRTASPSATGVRTVRPSPSGTSLSPSQVPTTASTTPTPTPTVTPTPTPTPTVTPTPTATAGTPTATVAPVPFVS